MSKLTVQMLVRMAVGQVSWHNVSGPIQIAQYAGDTARLGLSAFISFLAIVSISLGILNLLPVPVLDGGHLLYYVIEFLKGSPMPERVQAMGQQVGLFLLLLLMTVAFYNDITRLMG
jgi:regulator of sigma E protease